jgi:hypothetical protein
MNRCVRWADEAEKEQMQADIDAAGVDAKV